MKTIEEVMKLDVNAFFQYVETIRYGYQDQSGQLHFAADEDFTVREYAFSSPEDVVQNDCGWCWDVAELIKVYCAKHALPCRSWFMEYFSDELHQTHTQVFVYFQGKWCPAPDNSIGIRLGEHGFEDLNESVRWFVGWFTDHLRSVLGDKFDGKNLLVKEYTCAFPRGITDDEYLMKIRQ